MVALFVRDGEIVLAARMDLPALEHADQLAQYWSTLADSQLADRIGLIAYSADQSLATDLLTAVVGRLGDRELADVLYADGRRWWSIVCQRSCCPAEGTPYELDSHPVAVQAVLAGMGVQPDRTALAALVQGPTADELAQVDAVLEEVLAEQFDLLRDRAASVVAIRAAVSRGLTSTQLSARACAELALLCIDVVVRDHAWAMMSRDTVEEHLRLWGQVVARTPVDLAAGPLGLLGVAAWISGNGALLNCCGERLVAEHPDYGLGHILLDLSDRAVPPSYWDEWATDLRAALDPIPS